MRTYFVNDFNKQRKSITLLLMLTAVGTIVGYAFQSIYYCVGILLTAGIYIIFFLSFSEYLNIEKNKDEDRIAKISRRKLYVHIKYLEIIILATPLYLLMSVAYVLDAFDRNLFANPEFRLIENMGQISLYPLVFILLSSLTAPMLLNIKINKIGLISLAFISIAMPYAIFLLDFFISFTDMKMVMTVIPFPILGIAIIFYFIAMKLAIRGR
jgi:uncharacterized membrane protein